MILTKEEATEFFSDFYYGEHHFPGEIKRCGDGWSINHYGSLATFDSDELTRLVFLAHDYCCRMELGQAGPNRVKIAIWKRIREGRLMQRHPTLEEAVSEWRKDHKFIEGGDIMSEQIAGTEPATPKDPQQEDSGEDND